MNKKKITYLIFTIILSYNYAFTQQNFGAYEYPIKPGTDEWKTFTDHIDMINSCQIPSSLLKIMSTENLVETCLNYPLYGDMFCYNFFQQGFNNVSSTFNGLQELLSRNDAGIIVLEIYKKLSAKNFDQNWKMLNKGEYAAKLINIEMLLAQKSILSQLQNSQKKQLVQECIEKINEKLLFPDVYGRMSFSCISLIIGRLLVIENYNPIIQKIEVDKKIYSFLENGHIVDQVLFNEIFDLSNKYINYR